MKYKSEDIDLLLEQLNIVEVVGEFVDLKKSGANYKGLCPFHQDTNPSFIVSPSKNICKCFVCGKGGNPITFYSEYKKVSYAEAIQELAKKNKIQIKGISKEKVDENKEYYEIMESAFTFFSNKIFDNSARGALEYLSKRKISPTLIKNNGIGYAPNSWSELYDYLITQNYSKEKILELGLAKENEKGIYDAFRNRIIFPIYSISGKIIGFGGRTLEESKDIPKYINSQETPIFTKGKNLYGFIQKGSNIKKKNYSMLMEGYMDVLSAHSYGFDVALAPLGTALTEEQAKLLKRYTSNVILAFDMDTAGQMATERAIFILKSQGFNIRVLSYEDAKDPDEYLKKYGKEAFLKVVKESLEAFDYLYKRYLKEYNIEDTMSKQNFINRFKEYFQCIENQLEKTLYIDKLSKALDVDTEILKDILITNNKKIIRKSFEIKEKVTKEEKLEISDVERVTLALCLKSKKYYEILKNKNIRSSIGKKIFNYLEFLDESNLDFENASRDIKKNENISDLEEKEFAKILLLIYDEFAKPVKLERNFKDIFTAWFSIELKESLKQRGDILKSIKLKQIEDKLKNSEKIEELQDLYSNYRNIEKSK